MSMSLNAGRRFTAKLTAAVLCISMLSGSLRVSACAGEMEDASLADNPYRLVDIYCSQVARDVLGKDQLKALVDLTVASIEPQAVNLLIESFPCFKDAAANDELGREIGLYIYYGTGDQDGIEEHEDVLPGVFAYVVNAQSEEAGKNSHKYMICMDALSISEIDDTNDGVLNLDGRIRVQLDTTFCHELFHAFMADYNCTGMSGYTDYISYVYSPETQITAEEGDKLVEETRFPLWFMEGLAGCVGNIYPADLELFREYRYDLITQQYLDTCTSEQLCCMYANMGYWEGTGDQRYDLEASSEDNSNLQVNGAIYVSGYLACLYLADLGYKELTGSGAVTYDNNGGIEYISSEKLREGLSEILHRLHQGETLDEVISRISGGAYENTEDFTKRFIKGTYNEETQDYNGDPESLSFCVGYINYMNRLDAMDPETHPAGSLLMDDFGSTQTTPLEKDKVASSDFYRIIEQNTLTTSTVSNEDVKDGGTSYSAKDSFDTIVEMYKANH